MNKQPQTLKVHDFIFIVKFITSHGRKAFSLWAKYCIKWDKDLLKLVTNNSFHWSESPVCEVCSLTHQCLKHKCVSACLLLSIIPQDCRVNDCSKRRQVTGEWAVQAPQAASSQSARAESLKRDSRDGNDREEKERTDRRGRGEQFQHHWVNSPAQTQTFSSLPDRRSERSHSLYWLAFISRHLLASAGPDDTIKTHPGLPVSFVLRLIFLKCWHTKR